MLIEAFQDVLKDLATPEHLRRIESSRSCAHLWSQLTTNGLLELMTDEERGGAAMEWRELHAIFVLLGEFGMPAPIAQSILARSLLVGMYELPQETITIAPFSETVGAQLRCRNVAFGGRAEYVITQAGSDLVLLFAADAQRVATGIYHSDTADLTWSSVKPVFSAPLPSSTLELQSAAMHAALLAGAMSRVLQISLRYVADRYQFGKPIGKFQAVQQQMAVMAEHVAAARIASALAFRSVCTLRGTAVAKSRTSEAASVVTAIGHAVHGAIGITEEYDLQLFTRRLHEWRIADGAEDYWNLKLGELILREPKPSLAEFAKSL